MAENGFELNVRRMAREPGVFGDSEHPLTEFQQAARLMANVAVLLPTENFRSDLAVLNWKHNNPVPGATSQLQNQTQNDSEHRLTEFQRAGKLMANVAALITNEVYRRDLTKLILEYNDPATDKALSERGSDFLTKISGRAAFRDKLNHLGFRIDDDQLNNTFRWFKDLANRKGIVFDSDVEALMMPLSKDADQSAFSDRLVAFGFDVEEGQIDGLFSQFRELAEKNGVVSYPEFVALIPPENNNRPKPEDGGNGSINPQGPV